MIVLGSANMDIVVRAARAPAAGETVLGLNYALYPGGKGANQAVAASRAGATVAFVGRVGRDANGYALRAALAADGIDCAGMIGVATATGVALITVEDGGENRIIVVPGANHDFMPGELTAAMPPSVVLLAQLEIPVPTVLAAAALVRAAGGTVVLNASPIAGVDAAMRKALLEAADILVVNETEAAALLDIEALIDPAEAADRLSRGRRAAIVTLGKDGVVWQADGAAGQLASHAVTVVDTTACGDAFAGAFAAAFERGEDMAEAIAFGNAAGALTATQRGAQPSVPRREAIEGFLGR